MLYKLNKIETPTKVSWDCERKVSQLFWKDYIGKFVLAGGISFPQVQSVPGGIIMEGFAVTMGFDLANKIIYVFEESPYKYSISGSNDGLNNLLKLSFEKYFNRDWYYDKDDRLFRRYIVPIEKKQKKVLYHYIPIEVDFDREKVLLFELLTAERLYFKDGGRVHISLQYLQSNIIDSSVELLALVCALLGIEKKLEKKKIGSLTVC